MSVYNLVKSQKPGKQKGLQQGSSCIEREVVGWTMDAGAMKEEMWGTEGEGCNWEGKERENSTEKELEGRDK